MRSTSRFWTRAVLHRRPRLLKISSSIVAWTVRPSPTHGLETIYQTINEDLIIDHGLHVLAFTETWIRDDLPDSINEDLITDRGLNGLAITETWIRDDLPDSINEDLIIDHGLHVLAITETWIRDNLPDYQWRSHHRSWILLILAIIKMWIRDDAPNSIKLGLALNLSTISHVHRPIGPGGPSFGGGLAFITIDNFGMWDAFNTGNNETVVIRITSC